MSLPPPLPPSNPYAAPVARVEDFHGASLELADRAMRLVAFVVDYVITIGLFVVVGVLGALILPSVPKDSSNNDEIAFGLFGLLMVAAILAYVVVNMILLYRHGQTMGKRIFRIRIVRSDGSRCSLLRIIFARWLPVTLLSAIPLLGYVIWLVDALLIFRDDQRCMHDLIADTLVVKV